MEDCMCAKLGSCNLWQGIRFWLYMHPKDFLRQNNTGKLLWQVFGIQAAPLCLFGIQEHEDIMWDAFQRSGKGKVSFLYPNKSTTPMSVKDLKFDGLNLSCDRQEEDVKDGPFNFVLLDGTWSNSAALYRRLKERWTAIWGEEDIPCISLSTLSASVMHKLSRRGIVRAPQQQLLASSGNWTCGPSLVPLSWESRLGLWSVHWMSCLMLSRPDGFAWDDL